MHACMCFSMKCVHAGRHRTIKMACSLLCWGHFPCSNGPQSGLRSCKEHTHTWTLPAGIAMSLVRVASRKKVPLHFRQLLFPQANLASNPHWGLYDRNQYDSWSCLTCNWVSLCAAPWRFFPCLNYSQSALESQVLIICSSKNSVCRK